MRTVGSMKRVPKEDLMATVQTFDIIAICAAFAFLGAVVFGAFWIRHKLTTRVNGCSNRRRRLPGRRLCLKKT